MKIAFIRHGKTSGNLARRYIGRTDEPLCEEGAREIEINIMSGVYPTAERVYCSPMKRCLQTARMIYGDIPFAVCDHLRECDFGSFEGKNYRELAGNKDYQLWIDSGGTMDFPGGESSAGFRQRCEAAYLRIIKQLEKDVKNHCKNININAESSWSSNRRGSADAAFIIHGGVIMSVFSAFEQSGKGYFDWQIKNGGGFLCECNGRNGRLKILQEFKG
ncbi:MAG: histidine phosphatase family protein [Firmicutes bacterium]|nr:histidine phosphatase family protein [Bacillota bacterium]